MVSGPGGTLSWRSIRGEFNSFVPMWWMNSKKTRTRYNFTKASVEQAKGATSSTTGLRDYPDEAFNAGGATDQPCK